MKHRVASVVLAALTMALPAPARQSDEDPFMRGTRAFHMGQYELAAFSFRQALNPADPRFAETNYNLGACAYALGHSQEAIEWFEKARQIRKDGYFNAAYALGVVFEDVEDWARALGPLKEAVNLSGHKHVDALFRYALASQRSGDLATAAEGYRRAIAVSKDHLPAGRNNLGIILAVWNRLDEAEAQFTRALKVSKTNFPDARYNLGLCQRLRAAQSADLVAELKMTNSGSAGLGDVRND